MFPFVTSVTRCSLQLSDKSTVPIMARYIQKLALLGKERWIGWEIDGVGTEIAGLILADELPADDPRIHAVREFKQLPFETFLFMNAESTATSSFLVDEDVDFRLDALQVSIERIRCSGSTDVPRLFLTRMFGDDSQLDHPRVQERLQKWEHSGAIEFVGREECYLKIVGPLH
jgi:hypothetical protein